MDQAAMSTSTSTSTSTSIFPRLALLCLFIAALLQPATALDAAYCSDINTASLPGNSSIYQSNGLCYNFCLDSYAFAIIQKNLCWCSNYAPGSSVSTSQCDTKCPGFPYEYCGGDGLYGYFKLTKQASGTQATSGPGASTSLKTPVTAPGSTIVRTVILTASPAPTSSAPADSSSTATARSTASSSPTWTPTPITSVETVTGVLHTITMTPTEPPNSQAVQSKSSSLNTGQAVGLTVGLVALASIIALLIFFLLRRRRRQREDAASKLRPPSAAATRTMSETSRYMLGTDGRRVVEGWEGDTATPASAGSRLSRLMPVDPRLDPFAPVYQRGERGRSRESVRSIQDNHDYSRRVATGPVLRATNPDVDT